MFVLELTISRNIYYMSKNHYLDKGQEPSVTGTFFSNKGLLHVISSSLHINLGLGPR